MSDCSICVGTDTLRLSATSKLKAKVNLDSVIYAKPKAIAKLNISKIIQPAFVKVSTKGIGKIRAKANLKENITLKTNAEFVNIKSPLIISGSVRTSLKSNGRLNNSNVDKFAGNIDKLINSDFNPVQKLYPISDIQTSFNNSYFVNRLLSNDNLYQSIDEGVFTGSYHKNFGQSSIISDDNSSFIQPLSVFTSGTFRYKCEVTRPYHHPKDSFLFIRASAPGSNYNSKFPPEFRIHNIKLEDPSGNIIIKYKDITLRGDADYLSSNVNYSTYITEPEINNANLRTWENDYPVLFAESGYSLNMDFDIICLEDPFNVGFNEGYEEKICEPNFLTVGNNDYLSLDGTPLSTQTLGYNLNPANSIRISAIEICNSGDLCSSCSITGIKQEGYFGFYTEVSLTGQRISRTIYPVELISNSFNSNIYPEGYSTWSSSSITNATASGSRSLVSKINNLSSDDYISLSYSSPVSDSGRLTLKFSHQTPPQTPSFINGEFDFSSSSSAFDVADRRLLGDTDNFFIVDDIELKIIAKKAVGSRNYVLDVVGYSDDKLLNVTPKIGAFLQNTEAGTGNVPLVSGFYSIDDFGLSSESVSDKGQYYEKYLTSIDAGDHYKLSTLPVVNSTDFQEYTIPLSIYEDYVLLGKSKDYSMSSYFENLFIDLYPIPSGASISSIRLVVTYKPSNGMMLHTFGTPTNKELGQKDIKLLPLGRASSNDILLNSDATEAPLSIISGIPQAYGEPLTLKTNYARRWRGVDGNIVNGPYDPNQFDFSYYNPQANHPFLNGYYNLNNASGKFIISDDYSSSGYYNGQSSILKNIGWRFNDTQLFSNTTQYTSLDWATDTQPLNGLIADAFDSALRVSGLLSNINLGNMPLNSGFAMYLRFTPDVGMSGYNNHLFNSGVLISKWDSGKNLEFSLGYKNGFLNVLAKDTNNSVIELNDTVPYDEYQYPLSVLVTHVAGSPSGALRLYCNNEIFNNVHLRDEENVSISGGDSNIVIGYSSGSGIGSNFFVHEFGISSSGNLVHSNPNRLLKQTIASNFLEGHSHSFSHNTTGNNKFKLHEYANDNTSLWKLGSYKICSFSPDFDGFTTRIGKDYIIHYLKHSGSGYADLTNIALPSSVYASGLSYHTQIENDFLRFNLQDIPDANPQFYSTLPRICKTLPRGYDFTERALVVDSIIEHETNNDIIWSDGSIGPKLIVSLYSKNQDPVNRPDKVNWGLINRAIHYLKPSGCYEKISSTFNYNDLIDISEPWATFDIDRTLSEFDQKYYSTDINDMFLQYDLVYPSGSPFESIIKLHSANVRLENALTYFADSNNQLNLYASGESVSRGSINIYSYGLDSIGSGLTLYSSGSPWSTSSGTTNLFAYGVYGIPNNQFNLFVKNSGEVSVLGPNLYVSGGYPSDTQYINLFTSGSILDNSSSLNIFLKNSGPVYIDSSLPISMPEPYSFINFFRSESLSLFIGNNQAIVNNSSNNFNLYTFTDLGYVESSGSFNLVTINYLAFNQNLSQQASISWNKTNVGKSIDAIIDSGVPYLSANDEIRGVDLLCFGECGSSKECKETPITLHDIDWYGDQSCIDGGIFRVKNTYTNLSVSGFKTPEPYNGHFYGIRKYDGLIPNAPYNIIISTKTGNHNPITLPTKFKEIDYGSNEYVNYSGVKLAADIGLSPSERDSNNLYGKSVAVKYDLIAIGSPNQTVSYSEYDSLGNLVTTNLDDAGAVFLYRRNARSSGYSWPDENHKSSWELETKLILPSGMLKDYSTKTKRYSINGIPVPEPIIENNWNVGQEGRQFGHSLDLAINKNISSFEEAHREVLVVGGPSAKWSRSFEDLSTSGVNIGLLIFTDEFRPSPSDPNNPNSIFTYKDILSTIQNKDLVFRYFSDPPVRFDVKIIICEPLATGTNIITFDFPEPKPNFITKKTIPRNEGITPNTQAIYDSIKEAFDATFPYDTNKIHNNIPVMLGVYVDNSRSLGRQAVSPALDQFLEYYKQYSFASGLKYFTDATPSSGVVYEYTPQNFGAENWVVMSNTILNELLDTGRLVNEDQVKFFTSNIGSEYFNDNLAEFNYPPPSGGRVYVFEKESGVWNLIEEIQSPVVSYNTIDRFGHSVAISEDTNIIAVGSPYIDECCKIYQYNPQEKQRLFNQLYSWLNYKNSFAGGLDQRYAGLLEDYNTWVDTYNTAYANQILYSKLTTTEKFEARKYLSINEYENIFTYSYQDIPYVGTWDFIPKTFAPSSRLGYSAAVNDDGSIVAFGAPTDSFNAFDDYNVYYKNDGYLDPLNIDQINGTITPSWKSNVNAGAVRLFESRELFPHNKVVEYGKFGNLQESLVDPLDAGHFNYLSTIFQDKNFTKMPEGEVSIPKDAGLAFIITPGVDAASEEVIDNLKEWLSLGDRNLVIVGNDPIWEASGAYKTSNDIVNKILDGLNSKMRLYPARNQIESLSSGNSLVVPSFKPHNGTTSYIQPFNINTAYGVADIRMHFPGFGSRYMPCVDSKINTKCELPLSHNGDLRAQWLESCSYGDCGSRTIQYPVNWPFIFKTFTPDCCPVELVSINEGRFDLENQDPVPVLAAAELTTTQRIIPGSPELYQSVPIIEDKIYYTLNTIYEFDETNISTVPSFVWNADNDDFVSYDSNINGVTTNTWYRPDIFEDRQAVLQANATPFAETVISTQLVSTLPAYCVEQSIGSSKVIAIAGVETESQESLMSGAGDANINFYVNLVSKNASGGARIAQLGGWTGRTSFVDAYLYSILKDRFIYSGNDVNLDVQNLSVVDDVCWIANPANLPSQQNILDILSWMNTGNKKVIITHDNSISQMNIASQILNMLGTSIVPLYLPVKDEYARLTVRPLTFNPNNFVSLGFNVYPISSFNATVSYVPFADANNVTKICYSTVPVYDNKLTQNDYWEINSGLDKISFSAISGSGYKIFIDTISETPYENQSVQLYARNAIVQPKLPYPDQALSTSVIIPRGKGSSGDYVISNVGYINNLTSTTKNQINTSSFNIQVLQNEQSIDFVLNSFIPRITTSTHIPKTVRIVGISGVLLPIKSSVSQTGKTYKEVVGYNTIKIADAIPETVITESVTRQISTLNDKYCVDGDCSEYGLSNQYIADGPVVVAQEIESVSTFTAGLTRSRITVISDSSLVQGRFMSDEFGRMSAETVAFIKSLYPVVDFPLNTRGRQYNTNTKIVAPERGSPQKYYAVSHKSGNVERFNINGSIPSISSFSDKESMYDPRYVLRTELPWTDSTPEVVKDFLKQNEISDFISSQQAHGATAKFSGVIDGTLYEDIGIQGGMPQIMKDTGSDYLDFAKFPSGYPGDLFGFSVSLHKNKLVIGSPFSAFSDENINGWSAYISNNGQSGIKLSNNGGAGSAYIYEKTFNGSGVRNTKTPWEFIQKLRPSSINVGQDISNTGLSQSYLLLGPNSYSSNELLQFSSATDQFGYDVSIDSDIIVVGAPGHDFDKYTNNIYDSGHFIRKAFNEEFDIPSRLIIDLGNSGIRNSISSGTSVLNNGAIFAFENRISDWQTRSQKWSLVEKILPQGSYARIQNSNENDNFGKSVSIHRSNRSDSDYVIVGGSENHNYSSTGTSLLNNAGCAYTNDIMLRESPPAIANTGSYIDVNVFGERDNNGLPKVFVKTTNVLNDQIYRTSGIIYTNKYGAIFLEASGQDPALNGFIIHRPYVMSVDGLYYYGTENSGNMPLFVNGNIQKSENINLVITATTGNVYNNLGLYNSAIVDFGSGVLNFYTNCPEPTQILSSGLSLFMSSGVGISTDTLNMRIRGF